MGTLQDRRTAHAAELAHDLDAVVRQLAAMPAVCRIVLFGSYAAGRRDLLTDLDLLVVMDSSLDFVARNAQLAAQVHASVALDLLAYTPDEFARMRDRPFIRHALATGKVLYEKDSA